MWPFSTANERQAEAMSMILAENAYERRLERATNNIKLIIAVVATAGITFLTLVGMDIISNKPRSHLAIHSGRVIVNGNMWMFAGHLPLGSAQIATYVYRLLKPHRVGIYGPSMVGKTTSSISNCSRDIDPIPAELRITHPVRNGNFAMPRSTKKQVRFNGERTPITSSDIGGQQQYWGMWAKDIIDEHRDIIFYVAITE